MKLVDLLCILDENKRVDVYEKGKDGLIAQYNGKDSIPEAFNRCEVHKFEDFGSVVGVSIYPKVPTLAERLDKVIYDFDPYSYDSAVGSVAEAERIIRESPETVIEELVGMLESALEDIDAYAVEAGYGYKKGDK